MDEYLSQAEAFAVALSLTPILDAIENADLNQWKYAPSEDGSPGCDRGVVLSNINGKDIKITNREYSDDWRKVTLYIEDVPIGYFVRYGYYKMPTAPMYAHPQFHRLCEIEGRIRAFLDRPDPEAVAQEKRRKEQLLQETLQTRHDAIRDFLK
ncbi:MAG TPA: hypothetical protein VGK19_18225 [Capsulimonadaceae bacterium]|jgi:hypothetical protein